jgi:hypothetical protein
MAEKGTSDTSETRLCPYCKEEIKADAIKCKHCGSRLTPEKPSHGGTCPYCKEDIHPEATRCKHCRSDLLSDATEDCGCPDSAFQRVSSQAMIPQSWRSPVGFAPQGGGQPFRPYVGKGAPGGPSSSPVGPGVVVVSNERHCGDWVGRTALMGLSDVRCNWAERYCCDFELMCPWPPYEGMRCEYAQRGNCALDVVGFNCSRGYA